ncbi:MAG: hypothetical protein IT379_23700 [Deltaproteobacteria bacterium]|nr:hypothetical protein [Deltaproteobacteria bacterium]
MSDDRIETIRARWKSALPGPWRASDDEYDRLGREAYARDVARSLSAHAPDDVATLLERIGVLEAELADARLAASHCDWPGCTRPAGGE